MGLEIFKGANRRFLVLIDTPFEDGPLVVSDDDEKSTGFNDTLREVSGLSGKAPIGQEGGGAGGKTKLVLPPDYEKRRLELIKQLAEESSSIRVCEKVGLIKDSVKELVKEAFLKSKEMTKIKKENVYTIDPIVDQKPHETEYKVNHGDASTYMTIENSVRKEINVIQRKLFDLVTDEMTPRWIPGEDHGKRIDRRLISRIPMGERHFFKYKLETDVLNVAFSLLVDESGSMGGSKAHEARRCAVMFGKVLDKLGVPFEIIGFTTADLTTAQGEEYSRARHGSGYYNRSENLRHFMYKRFTEQYNAIKTRLVNIDAYCNNYDQDNIEFTWNRLQRYTYANNIERKVLIVISDGQPNGGEEGRVKLKAIINEIGCDPNAEVIGIGIHSPYVKDFYHKCIEIEDVSQLGINVVKLIQSAIQKGRRKW